MDMSLVGRLVLPLVLLSTCPSCLLTENVALGRYTWQHGTQGTHTANLAVDGNLDQDASRLGCAISNSRDGRVYTTGTIPSPTHWTVDMASNTRGFNYYIQRVIIYPRLDQFRRSIIGAQIKVGTMSDFNQQYECAVIRSANNIIYQPCNPVDPIRYLSIVSSGVSLHLCEVIVEGFPVAVANKPVFAAPNVLEILDTSIILHVSPPFVYPWTFQVIYSALSGTAQEQYGGKSSNIRIKVDNLLRGTRYKIHVLALEGILELVNSMSDAAYVTLPYIYELPQLRTPPELLTLGHTQIEIKFTGDQKAEIYQAQAVSYISSEQTAFFSSDEDRTVHTKLLQNLQPGTHYVVAVTPYYYEHQTRIRGLISPALDVRTLGAVQPVQSTLWPKTPTFYPTATPGRPVMTSVPPWRVSTTRIPTWTTRPNYPSSTHSSKEPILCPTETGQPCAPAPITANDWLIPMIGGTVGGVVLLLVIVVVSVCLCHRRRHQAAKGGLGDKLARRSGEYNDYETTDPQYYSNTLPQNIDVTTVSGIYSNGSEIGPVPVLPSKLDRPPFPVKAQPTTEDENKLHEDIDLLYAKINKPLPAAYRSQQRLN